MFNSSRRLAARWIGARKGPEKLWHLFALLLILVGVAAPVLLLTGCEGSAVTGGGVPLGGTRAEASGLVVQSTNTDEVVTGAQVVLQASDGSIYTTTTDANGNYFFPSVPVGPGTINVTPPDSAHLHPQQLPVNVDKDAPESVLVSLSPASGPGTATGLVISPPAIQAHSGDHIPLTASLTGTDIPAGAQPSYVVTGGVGHIIRQNIFVASRPGSGFILAVYEGQTTRVPVTVD
ncbi:MAG: carboxypeptidase-like regulatory domain-containing protein [Chloroflexi bacterium]|nr:carboxypeptidase-like regulatory domain-containing protein [Chloroflexota bacterium]